MNAIYCFLLCATTAAAADIRIVNGAAVDISPLAEWASQPRSKRGERPLPAWKAIEIVSIEQTTFAKCTVRIGDSKSSKEIMLNNCPRAAIDYYNKRRHLVEKHKQLQERLKAMRQQLKAIGRASSGYTDLYLKTQDLEDDIKEIQQELGSLSLQASALREYAFFTGRTYGLLEIWDCGVKRP